jgi:glutathione S-transferase
LWLPLLPRPLPQRRSQPNSDQIGISDCDLTSRFPRFSEIANTFERVRALHGDCNRTDFLHVNPRAEVPALVDGDFSLYDSTIICEYLDRYPEPSLYPRDSRLRAECRLIEDLADTQLDAGTFAVAIVELGRRESHAALHDTAGRDLERLYNELEQRLARGPFFCGNFSLADIAVAPHVMAAAFLGFPLDDSRHPRLSRWMKRVQERPSIARDNADVVETLQRLQAEGQPGFDPYRVQWRSDRLEWVIKNGLADWFAEEMRGRTGLLSR